jgi:NAD(P)-dependent dehydrogenase (short-subunit alcohol dehydrogenase family)
MNRFDETSTTDQVIDGISLQGKLAVVTGASSGLGTETCRVLAAAGAAVMMVGRDEDKLQAVMQEIQQAQPEAELHVQCMDLADLNSVRNAATEILLYHPEIQLLINNAGVMACPLLRTAQGFEMQFGTNHLGHFLFTGLLAQALIDGAPRAINSRLSISRTPRTSIVNTTSGGLTGNPRPPMCCSQSPWICVPGKEACAPLLSTRA